MDEIYFAETIKAIDTPEFENILRQEAKNLSCSLDLSDASDHGTCEIEADDIDVDDWEIHDDVIDVTLVVYFTDQIQTSCPEIQVDQDSKEARIVIYINREKGTFRQGELIECWNQDSNDIY